MEPSLLRRARSGLVAALNAKVRGFLRKAWEVAVDDPRKVVHGLKVGLALTLVSLFYYVRPLYDGVGRNAMWAIMTVVVISEFTVGGSLYKGLNRVCATLSAGFLALGVRWLASKSGHIGQPIILGASLFLLGSAATFSRFIPTIRTRFDYGVLIFILTYGFVSVSAYRVQELSALAEQRLSTIVIGCSICWTVIMFICPVWAGGDLHRLVAANIQKLANSIQGCVDDFFGNGKTSQMSRSYMAVLNSKASEDSLASLARWEPPHGNFGFRHPWQQYLKVTAALRHCAYSVEALHACIVSDVEILEATKKHLVSACMELSSQSSAVLMELSNSIATLTRSSRIDVLVEEMNSAVLDLKDAIATLPNIVAPPPPPPPPAVQPVSPPQEEEATGQEKQQLPSAIPLVALLPAATAASMLIEVASRIEGVVEAVNSLAHAARFSAASDEKPKQSAEASEGDEGVKNLQMV